MIAIRGAREHNLKNIDVEIPRDQLVVFTGLSGSGKSSLAFDTIYAEGQRRYVESLSAYARQFLEMMQKPDVDQIDGLSPAISIEQKTTSSNPRSTVGTVTEIYDYMRLLWARVGVPYSPATGLPIESQTVSQMVDRVMALPEGTRLYLLAPVVRGRKGEYRKELADYMKKGFQRVKIDGTFYEIAEAPALDKKFNHDIDVVVDRIVVRPDIATRLAELARDRAEARRRPGGRRIRRRARRRSAGGGARKEAAKIHDQSGPSASIFSEKFACPVSGFTIPEIEPRLFSFNNPFGACPACGGLGVEQHIDADLVIPDKDKHLARRRDRAVGEIVVALLHPDAAGARQALQVHARHQVEGPAEEDAGRDPLRLRRGRHQVHLRRRHALLSDHQAVRRRRHQPGAALEGDRERLGARGDGEILHRHPVRRLQRLPAQARGAVREDRRAAHRRGRRDVGQSAPASGSPSCRSGSPRSRTRSPVRVLKEIRERLKFLVDVGLEYLTLARASGTLSGGESQRIRLASQIGSGLTGVLYVLDEPSIGLHQRDNARLLETLKRLRDLGNTVIVVEHDEDAIRTADHVLDIGPGAGIHGGHIVAQGTLDDIIARRRIADRQISLRRD